MKISGLFAAALAAVNLFAATPVVTSVTARQRYPWNGKVDIAVTFSGSSNDVALAACTFVATNSVAQAALAMAHVADAETISGAGATWTRRFVWDATADLGEVKIDDVTLSVEAVMPRPEPEFGGVQLWEGGPYWAECNVGATKPEEYGYYFWWGDTVGYRRNAGNNGWVSVKDGASFSFSDGNCPTQGKYNSSLQSQGYIDATGNLVAKHDAATAYLSAPWRMPTDAEFSALVSNCTTTWTTRNGVYGRLVTGKGVYASKRIFLPAAGYGSGTFFGNAGATGEFWSSTPHSDYSGGAWFLSLYSGSFRLGNEVRSVGRSVRPLRGFFK